MCNVIGILTLPFFKNDLISRLPQMKGMMTRSFESGRESDLIGPQHAAQTLRSKSMELALSWLAG